jgi:hypothetical protein
MAGPPGLPDLTEAQEAESNLPRIIAVVAVFHALALVFVGVRLYIRFIVLKAPKLDDALMILATIGAIGGMICFILEAPRGIGRHLQTLSDEDYNMIRRLNFIYILCCVATCFSLLKVSIALSLLRLSRTRWYVYSLYTLIGFIACYTIVAFGSILAYCSPIEGNWDDTVDAKCYSIDLYITFAILNTSCSMLSDVVCATLPIPIIWSLKMKLRTRIYLVIILSLGYLTVSIGVTKAYFQMQPKRNLDSTFEQNIQFFGFLQFNLGIIVACAPTLRPLLGRALKLSSHDKYSGGYYADNRGVKSGHLSSRRRTAGQGLEFELQEAGGLDGNSNIKTTVRGEGAIYSKELNDGSGSEEMILQGIEPKGILRTTEIEIRRIA